MLLRLGSAMTRPIKLTAGRMVSRFRGRGADIEQALGRLGGEGRAILQASGCVGEGLHRRRASLVRAVSALAERDGSKQNARPGQGCCRHRRDLQASPPRIAEQQSETESGKCEACAPSRCPAMVMLIGRARGLRQGEGIHQQVVALPGVDREDDFHRSRQLLIGEGRGIDAVGRSRGLDGRGVADGDLQGRIGNRFVGDGVVDEDREAVIPEDADDLIQVGSCGDPWISRGNHRGFVAISVIVPLVGDGNGQTKKKARQASKAGCAKPREPPFQAAWNRKH